MTTDMQEQIRILTIDDNPAIHQDFFKILTMTKDSTQELNQLDEALFGETEFKNEILLNFKIDTATQGEEGVEKIKQAYSQGKPYAIVFVDVRMPPGWDGIETIKHILPIDSNIQVVICTAYTDYSWEETIEQLGMRDNILILKKPFDTITVRQLACSLMKKWQLIRKTQKQTKFLEETIQERTQSLQESLSLTRSTIESSTDGILVVNHDHKIIDYNDRFKKMWDISQKIIDSKDENLFLKNAADQLISPAEFLKSTKEISSNKGDVSVDTLNFKDGRVFERYSQPHLLNGISIGRVWSFKDITDRFYLEKKLEHQAFHDSLTDLPNRVLLIDRIKHGIIVSKRNSSLSGIIFLDVDRFKLINDSLGHQAGDQLLIQISNRLKEALRQSDTLARIGGDEFVMVIPDIKKKSQLITVIHKLLEQFKESFVLLNRSIIVTTSIGISIFPDDGDHTEELLRNADLAMYQAKREGLNQYRFYMKSMNEDSLRILEIETGIRRGIANGEFFLVYQCQIDAKTEKIIGIEALIRWNNPQKGILLPIDFIPHAETCGLIVPLGEWVIREACKQCKEWQDSHLKLVPIAVNVAAQQFRQPNFIELIKEILDETGLDPKYLEIEVTENVVLSNMAILDVVQKIRELGVRVALDDFGTGNSSLYYLRHTAFDRLKIDKSFIANINSNPNDEVLIKSIIAMAHSLNLDVIAEGIETKSQLDFLVNEACSEFQGHYFSKPLTADEFKKLLPIIKK
ncbi:MAG: EAL domain-containing protein [Proteobacteria bacterium]|nr:EAL domain-containing protein [Pseudomonadota bacterium]